LGCGALVSSRAGRRLLRHDLYHGREITEYGLTSAVGAMTGVPGRRAVGELRSLGRALERSGRSHAVRNRLLHCVTVARSYKALVLRRLITVLMFAAEFLLLQA